MWYDFAMSVYIEYVIADNLAVDTLILCLVFWSLKEKVPKLRVFCSAAMGTAMACLLPLFTLHWALLLLVKVTISVAMVLLVKGKRKFFLYFVLFYLYTFLFGGAVVGIFYLAAGDFGLSDGALSYELDVPMGLFVAGILLVVVLAKKLFALFYRRREQENFTREVRIVWGGREITAKGYVDSGNLLTYRGLPVVLADCDTVLRLLGVKDFGGLDSHNPSFEYIEIGTMSGTKRVPLFRVDKLFADGAEYDGVYCGISFEKFKTACEVLLNCMTR